MSTKNLSSVATAVIESYGHTAMNMIQTYRVGSERAIGFFDQRWETAINAGAARLSEEFRSNLLGTQKRLSGYYAKGLQVGTDRAETVVSTVVDLASKGVDRIAANAERFDQATNFGALEMLNRVALPAATVVSQVVERIEEGSSQLAKRVAGKPAIVRKATRAVKPKVKAVKKAVKQTVAKTTEKATAAKRVVVRKARTVAKAVAAE